MRRYFHELLFSLLQFLKVSITVKKEWFLVRCVTDLQCSKQKIFGCTSYILISLLLKSCTWGKKNPIFWTLPLILLGPTPLVKDKHVHVLVYLKYKKVSTKTCNKFWRKGRSISETGLILISILLITAITQKLQWHLSIYFYVLFGLFKDGVTSLKMSSA